MNRNPIPIVLPCHRIVGANGSLTGYAGGLEVKRRLLELEGARLPGEQGEQAGHRGRRRVRGAAGRPRLGGADLDVTLVDRENYFLFQPLAYQVATGALSSVEVAAPLRQVLRRHKRAHVVLGEVTGFDLAARKVVVENLPNGDDRRELDYDILVVAGGSRTPTSATTSGRCTRPS